MKKILYVLLFVLLIGCVVLPVNASSDYYKDIVVTFNHNGCDEQAGKEVIIQLFENGEKVEGQEISLNERTGYTYTFEDLPIFKP